ncbi:hypothetical protein NLJ89_g6684 [Agrocybe chaxingu]|uniref:DDE-1 domain-containing protein n=1 Tax=Agrocybe chaxingu TaxID=84603 RepID=A0A9W8MSG2_9AGAR|nr:hypothetical protein NLJ89_g6684 [Agrocybe chaxingu]
MAGQALSEQVKKQAHRREENQCMQAAVDVYLQEQEKLDGVKKRGLRPIAKDHGVDPTTLQHLAKGGVSMSVFNASKGKLTFAKERVLIDFILESADRALPMNYSNIEEHANAILHGHNPEAEGENITVLVTICANGTALKLTVIFKGQQILAKWTQGNISEVSICALENGWTDGGLALNWIQKDFDPQT